MIPELADALHVDLETRSSVALRQAGPHVCENDYPGEEALQDFLKSRKYLDCRIAKIPGKPITVAEPEEWREIAGWPGYLVSSLGRVRGPRGWVLSTPLRTGYPSVSLRRHKKEYVHILVLEAFVGPRPSKEFDADHKDHNRTNCTLTNLRWRSSTANRRDHNALFGEAHPCAKLDEDSVKYIRRSDKTYRELAEMFGCSSEMSIWNAKHGKTWAHVP